MEVLNTDRRTLEFSYADRDNFAFLDPGSYETVELSAAMIGEAKYYLVANGKVEVLFVDDRPVTVDLPASAALKVTDAPEGIRGDTASNVQKTVTCETGLIVQAPLFIKKGDVIRVSTADGSYLGRA
jgi:elongation factor P